MTYIEYALYDLDFNEEEIKSSIDAAISLNVDCLSVPYYLTKSCKAAVKNTNIKIANPIDYPLGILDSLSRNQIVVNAINNGTDSVQIVIQNHYLNYKKYDKLRQDIQSNYEICQKHNISISYILEYRVFTHQSLIKACNLLLEAPIQNIYVSSGHMLDNVEDNIIATILLKEKTGINTIFTGNIWTKNHVQLLKKNNIDSLKLNNINSIRLYKEFS